MITKPFLRLFKVLLPLCSVCFQLHAGKLIDLEEHIPDFVLETKKLVIRGYDDAFNPSVMRWDDRLLLSFRIRDPITQFTDQIGFIWLDENFEAISSPYVLEVRIQNPYPLSKAQDPRLITVAGKPYIVYSDISALTIGANRRVFIAELHWDNEVFYIEEPYKLINFEGDLIQKQEKNWVPFEYMGHLLFAYKINPHIILNPLFLESRCETAEKTKCELSWKWGELRGGSTALLVDGEYLSFFHSSKPMTTVNSEGMQMTHYFMGAYTFAQHPPFQMTGISPEPIVGKNFYKGEMHNTWKPLRVVFPGGFIYDDQTVWVVYGRQDHECWVVKLDKQGLLKSLLPVSNNILEKP